MAASRKRPRSMVKLSSTRLFRAVFLSALLADLPWLLSFQAQVVIAIILAFMLASSAFNWISSCHKKGLEMTLNSRTQNNWY